MVAYISMIYHSVENWCGLFLGFNWFRFYLFFCLTLLRPIYPMINNRQLNIIEKWSRLFPGLLNGPELNSLLSTLIDSRGHNAGGVGSLISCSNNTLSVEWPTDKIYYANTSALPQSLKTKLMDRLRAKGSTLMIVLYNVVPRWVSIVSSEYSVLRMQVHHAQYPYLQAVTRTFRQQVTAYVSKDIKLLICRKSYPLLMSV